MFKSIALVAIFVGVALGAPQTFGRPMLDGRIVGGVDTTIQAHPYIVSLLWFGSHLCGGGIISSTWVVTAAHCVVGGAVSSYGIRAGSAIRNSGGQTISASRILIHASYSGSTIDYDIALVQLTSPITIANALPIALPPANAGPTAGATATITGWGAISEGGPSATILQQVQVPVVSQADCRSAYSVSAITDRMFCAGLLGVGGQDACQGDSGGPVVVNNVLSGLVSWGNGCARPSHPGVKTNLHALRGWIDNAIASSSYADVIEL